MNFPNATKDAKVLVLNWTGPIAARHEAECALDFLILIEPEDDSDYEANATLMASGYLAEISRAMAILKAYGEQITPKNIDAMQWEFYSFSNLAKYRFSACTIGVVRSALCEAWDGIAGWRN